MSTFCERTNSSDVSWCKKWILALAIVQTLSMGKSFLFMTGKGDGDGISFAPVAELLEDRLQGLACGRE